MIEFELDIPSLTEDGIQMDDEENFSNVKELFCSSKIDELLLIEMLILFLDSLNKRVIICELRGILKCLLIIKTMVVKTL